jgi:choline-glycine betaine transporter
LPPEPVFRALVSDEDSVFALVVFGLFFFSVLEPVCPSMDFGRLDLGFADDLDAFANTVFLGVGLGAGFGVGLVFAAGVVVFGTGVAIGVGFGVGKSISLFG